MGEPIDAKVPGDFICPITKKVMTSPLVSKSGHNYERDAVLELLHGGGGVAECPATGKTIRASDLVPNRLLEIKIQLWRRHNGMQDADCLSCSSSRLLGSVVVADSDVSSATTIATNKAKKDNNTIADDAASSVLCFLPLSTAAAAGTTAGTASSSTSLLSSMDSLDACSQHTTKKEMRSRRRKHRELRKTLADIARDLSEL